MEETMSRQVIKQAEEDRRVNDDHRVVAVRHEISQVAAVAVVRATAMAQVDHLIARVPIVRDRAKTVVVAI